MKYYIKASDDMQNAKDLIFDLIYNYCKETCGVSTNFYEPLTREEYYEEFDSRFESSVYDAIAHYFARDFDIGIQEVNIIAEAVLSRASNDANLAYRKHDQYDELIDEWVLPVAGE